MTPPFDLFAELFAGRGTAATAFEAGQGQHGKHEKPGCQFQIGRRHTGGQTERHQLVIDDRTDKRSKELSEDAVFANNRLADHEGGQTIDQDAKAHIHIGKAL